MHEDLIVACQILVICFVDFELYCLMHRVSIGSQMIDLFLCLSLMLFLYPKFSLVDINTSTSTFPWVMLAFCIIFHPSIFNLSVALCLSIEFLIFNTLLGHVYLVHSANLPICFI
jgi:hypothetical protein